MPWKGKKTPTISKHPHEFREKPHVRKRVHLLLHSILFLAMVLIGGLGRLVGTVFGVIFVTFIPILLDLIVSFLAQTYDPNITVYLGPMKEFVFGGLIIVFIIFEPEGLVGIWIRIRDYFKIWPLPYISG